MDAFRQCSFFQIVSIIIIFQMLTSMYLFSNKSLKIIQKKSPIITPLESIVQSIGFPTHGTFIQCDHNVFLVPSHGKYNISPTYFAFHKDDYIFDVSPAYFQPWRHHRRHFDHYISFKFTDASMYSLETINVTLFEKDIMKIVRHYEKLLYPQKNKFLSYKRVIFLCNIPHCVNHLFMMMAFMNVFSLYLSRPCASFMISNPRYFQRFVDSNETFFMDDSLQYISFLKSPMDYNPYIYQDEDLYPNEYFDIFKSSINSFQFLKD